MWVRMHIFTWLLDNHDSVFEKKMTTAYTNECDSSDYYKQKNDSQHQTSLT